MNHIIALLAGASAWTFLEYALHSWNGHRMKGRTSFSRLHLAHHANPRFFAPTLYKVASAVPVVGGAGLLAGLAFGAGIGFTFGIGLGVMYFAYEVTHRRTHTHPPRGPYSRWTRRNHLLHHFHSPNTNHGVTVPFWDHVFGTHVRPDVVRVPRRHAPDWMVDAATGAVRPEYSRDYVITGHGRNVAEVGAGAESLATV